MWTVEEDLRLLEAISTYGLGNWADMSEEDQLTFTFALEQSFHFPIW